MACRVVYAALLLSLAAPVICQDDDRITIGMDGSVDAHLPSLPSLVEDTAPPPPAPTVVQPIPQDVCQSQASLLETQRLQLQRQAAAVRSMETELRHMREIYSHVTMPALEIPRFKWSQRATSLLIVVQLPKWSGDQPEVTCLPQSVLLLSKGYRLFLPLLHSIKSNQCNVRKEGLKELHIHLHKDGVSHWSSLTQSSAALWNSKMQMDLARWTEPEEQMYAFDYMPGNVKELTAHALNGLQRKQALVLFFNNRSVSSGFHSLLANFTEASSDPASASTIFATVNCSRAENQQLVKKHNLKALPEIQLFKNGVMRPYTGLLTTQGITNYTKDLHLPVAPIVHNISEMEALETMPHTIVGAFPMKNSNPAREFLKTANACRGRCNVNFFIADDAMITSLHEVISGDADNNGPARSTQMQRPHLVALKQWDANIFEPYAGKMQMQQILNWTMKVAHPLLFDFEDIDQKAAMFQRSERFFILFVYNGSSALGRHSVNMTFAEQVAKKVVGTAVCTLLDGDKEKDMMDSDFSFARRGLENPKLGWSVVIARVDSHRWQESPNVEPMPDEFFNYELHPGEEDPDDLVDILSRIISGSWTTEMSYGGADYMPKIKNDSTIQDLWRATQLLLKRQKDLNLQDNPAKGRQDALSYLNRIMDQVDKPDLELLLAWGKVSHLPVWTMEQLLANGTATTQQYMEVCEMLLTHNRPMEALNLLTKALLRTKLPVWKPVSREEELLLVEFMRLLSIYHPAVEWHEYLNQQQKRTYFPSKIPLKGYGLLDLAVSSGSFSADQRREWSEQAAMDSWACIAQMYSSPITTLKLAQQSMQRLQAYASEQQDLIMCGHTCKEVVNLEANCHALTWEVGCDNAPPPDGFAANDTLSKFCPESCAVKFDDHDFVHQYTEEQRHRELCADMVEMEPTDLVMHNIPVTERNNIPGGTSTGGLKPVVESGSGVVWRTTKGHRVVNIPQDLGSVDDFECFSNHTLTLSEDELQRQELFPAKLALAEAMFKKCGFLVIDQLFSKSFVKSMRKGMVNMLGDRYDRNGPAHLAVRHAGRVDVSLGMVSPFNSTDLISNHVLLPLLYSLVGEECYLSYAGCVMSFPGAPGQKWHLDATVPPYSTLNEADSPPWMINTFIPLTDYTTENALEVMVGSHKKFFNKTHRVTPLKVLAKEGSAIMLDYRITHRGGNNTSPHVRPAVYLEYTSAYYKENTGNNREAWSKMHVDPTIQSVMSGEAHDFKNHLRALETPMESVDHRVSPQQWW